MYFLKRDSSILEVTISKKSPAASFCQTSNNDIPWTSNKNQSRRINLTFCYVNRSGRALDMLELVFPRLFDNVYGLLRAVLPYKPVTYQNRSEKIWRKFASSRMVVVVRQETYQAQRNAVVIWAPQVRNQIQNYESHFEWAFERELFGKLYNSQPKTVKSIPMKDAAGTKYQH